MTGGEGSDGIRRDTARTNEPPEQRISLSQAMGTTVAEGQGAPRSHPRTASHFAFAARSISSRSSTLACAAAEASAAARDASSALSDALGFRTVKSKGCERGQQCRRGGGGGEQKAAESAY